MPYMHADMYVCLTDQPINLEAYIINRHSHAPYVKWGLAVLNTSY